MTFSLTKFIDTINMYYTIHDIYKSFIICNNDNDVHNVALLMENELYTVCTITLNDISLDNTNLYNNKLAYFNSIKYRVMIISYDVWELLRNELEINILPEQNLIILYLNDANSTQIYNWVKDTLHRGFITRPSSNILVIQNDTPHIEILIDKNYCKNNTGDTVETYTHNFIY